ncbi:MocR-like pyridoxine biosynthesis transcription factor PdxR [Myceligenerans cantabricum]
MPPHRLPGPGKTAGTAALLREMIHDGRLAEGDPLPSTRALAAELGVSRGTVVAAYEQLDGEGYLHTRHGAVSRVAATLAPRPAAPRDPASPRSGAAGCRAARSGAASGAAADGAAPGGATRRGAASGGAVPGGAASGGATRPPVPSSHLVDLTPGLPRATAVSRKDWRAALRYAASVPLTDTFPDPAGLSDLRSQVAAHLALGRGLAPDAGRVLITSGTAEALSLLADASRPAAGGRGPRVGVENPGYGAGRSALASAGGELVPIPVDDDGLRLDALRAAHARRRLDAVMVTPSHQYPMGGVMPVAHRQELCAWAAAEGVLVIEDDYDSEFRHRGAPLPPLAAMDAGGAVVHVGTFSKVFDPHLRCGYLVLPDGGPHSGGIRRARGARGPAVATVLQHALAHLMATGALRRHVARCRRDYRHKRSMVAEALAGIEGVRLRALAGGLHAVLELTGPGEGEPTEGDRRERGPQEGHPREDGPEEGDPEEGDPARGEDRGQVLVDRIAARGVRLANLRGYLVPGRGPGPALSGVVLGYGAVPAAALRPALEIIREEVTAWAAAPAITPPARAAPATSRRTTAPRDRSPA